MVKKITRKARGPAYVKVQNVMYSPKKNKITLAPHDETLDIYYSPEWEYIGPYELYEKETPMDKKNEDLN